MNIPPTTTPRKFHPIPTPKTHAKNPAHSPPIHPHLGPSPTTASLQTESQPPVSALTYTKPKRQKRCPGVPARSRLNRGRTCRPKRVRPPDDLHQKTTRLRPHGAWWWVPGAPPGWGAVVGRWPAGGWPCRAARLAARQSSPLPCCAPTATLQTSEPASLPARAREPRHGAGSAPRHDLALTAATNRI